MRFKGELFPYQEKAKAFAIQARYSICALEMGLGKTAVALATACEVKAKNVLIVCPAYLRENWKEEIVKFTEELNTTVVSYSQLSKINPKGWDFICCDEAHYLKNIKAQRTKHLYNIVDKSKANYVILLSGTPVKNRVPDIWSLMNICSWHGLHNFPYLMAQWRFNKTFCFEKTVNVNGFKIKQYEGLRPERVPELKELLKPMYFRLKLEQVAMELPSVTKKIVKIDNKSGHDKDLKEALKELGHSKATAFATVKSANALAKVKHTVELACEVGESGKVVIFSDHVASAKAIAKELKCNFIIGSIPSDIRLGIVKGFKQGTDKFLVATIGALSTGVNLTEANYMIFNDFAWVATDMEQAEKRIHRIGQKNPCFYYYVMSSDVDEMIYKTVMKKAKDAKVLQ